MVRTSLSLMVLAFSAMSVPMARAQLPADQQAEMVLASARKAFIEKNYPFAVERYREFLQKYGGHAKASDARFGLAMTLLELPERNHTLVIEQLQPLAGNRGFTEFGQVHYYLGLSKRAQGLSELAQASAKPGEAPQRRQTATQRFTESQKHFADAAAAFQEKVKIDPAAKEPSVELEWVARCLCDRAEMEIRLQRAKEAVATTTPFVKDPALGKSRHQRLGLYYHGYGSFLIKDLPGAMRALNRQDLFTDAVFGGHVRYLLGRIHQNDGEMAEAAQQYEAVLADYTKRRAEAVEALKRPDQFRSNPEEKARLEALVKSPPDHVAGAAFGAATLHYEGARFGEALARFIEFAKQHPDTPRGYEALLHVGFCQVQLKQFNEAVATLTPLVQKVPAFADQALLWIGKAQAANFDPNNPTARSQALTAAINSLRQAADRAGQIPNDPEAKARRAEILLELADAQQLAGQHREAAAVYEQLWNEKVPAHRLEEIAQRLASAWHLAGDHQRSDQVCERFFRDFPQSPLRANVAFQMAENAYFVALAAEKNPNFPNRTTELPKLYDEAGKRFRTVIEKYPEFERVGVARFSLGVTLHRKGDYEGAQKVLDAIAAPDRQGELALTSYILADCLLRQAPAKVADDAIAAGKLQEQLQAAAQLLDAYANANLQAPEAPDALMKLGYCHQRLATILAQPQEKAAAVQAARVAYDKVRSQFPNDPLAAVALFERCKATAIGGDRNGAMNELRRFQQAPLQDSKVAPLALLRLATYHREQNQAAEAVKVLEECRKKHEAALAADKERASWAPLLKYHHAVALLEWNKPAEARALFDQLTQGGIDSVLATEAALRGGQCRFIEGKLRVDAARQKWAAAKPEEKANAARAIDEALNGIRETGRFLETQAEAFKSVSPAIEARGRMYYDAAWAFRYTADLEVAAVRDRLQQEAAKKQQDDLAKKLPPNSKLPPLPPVEVARKDIPVQPSEEKARAAYRRLIEGMGDLPLAIEARFELSEMLADRAEYDPAIQLLKDALDKEPAQELTDRVRLRLGGCLAAKKDPKGALTHFDSISDPKSPSFAQAQYRAAECLIDLGDFPKAATRLAIFRDKGEYHNLPGLSDRAMLRLGYALAKADQWEPSRQAYDTLIQRYGNSPWVPDARYGSAWARQKMKQYDEAVNGYTQVTAVTLTDLGAKAQLQIGICRMEQKRYAEAASALLIVATTYDYPELSAAALMEAARAYTELKNKDQAERLLQRILRDHPNTEWSKAAQERLDALKK